MNNKEKIISKMKSFLTGFVILLVCAAVFIAWYMHMSRAAKPMADLAQYGFDQFSIDGINDFCDDIRIKTSIYDFAPDSMEYSYKQDDYDAQNKSLVINVEVRLKSQDIDGFFTTEKDSIKANELLSLFEKLYKVYSGKQYKYSKSDTNETVIVSFERTNIWINSPENKYSGIFASGSSIFVNSTLVKSEGGNQLNTNYSDQGKDSTPNTDNKTAWVAAEDYMRTQLKNPRDADFCSYTEATIVQNENTGIYTIKGYVDATNDLGAVIRTNFTVNLELTENGYKNASAITY